MTLKILVVDDSPFFQKRLSEIINEHPQLEVAGVANNGREAIEKVKSLQPDLVTMDYEMPVMDGVTAVKIIMSENPLPILMLSSMTFPDAKITIDALEAGAVDFITKNFSEISNKSATIKQHLYKRLLAIGERVLRTRDRVTTTATASREEPKATLKPSNVRDSNRITSRNHSVKANSQHRLYESSSKIKIVAIGASTGGPSAITEIIKKLPKSFPLPIIIVQHMPENFTLPFSERLNKQCQIEVRQAETGDTLLPGTALLAPGGKQLIVDPKNSTKVKVIESSREVNYKPCVDISFASLSNTYGRSTLAIVLTGMGHDGRDGAQLLKQEKATVWTQEKESCIVYGMPMAIDKANYSNASLSLEKIYEHLSDL